MTRCVTAMQNFPSWDSLYEEWDTCVDIYNDWRYVEVARSNWRFTSPDTELQEAWDEQPSVYAVPWLEATDADLPVPCLLRRAVDTSAAKSDADWRTAVESLVLAAECGALPRLARSARRRGALPVDVGPTLKAKIRDSKPYTAFVDAVVDACRSPRAVSLGTTKYAIEEKRNMENPRWVTITLTAWFRDPDFDARMDKWAEMRNIVDGYTARLMHGDDKDEMLDIDSRFFISMGSKYD